MTEAILSASPTRAGHSGRSSTDMLPQGPVSGQTVESAEGSGAEVENQDSKEPLEEYDWEKLEERFSAKMGERQAAETEIYKEFNTLLAVRYKEVFRAIFKC